MKDNEKVMSYISTFKFCFKKWLHPAYSILKPLISYIRSIWGAKGVQSVLYGRFFIFPTLGTTLTIKEL
jgi:hypothetical protein